MHTTQAGTQQGGDSRTFSVTVDFAHATVSANMADDLLPTLVEYIQEDRVTAGDDVAQVCAEVLSHYLRTGDVDTAHAALLIEAASAAV